MEIQGFSSGSINSISGMYAKGASAVAPKKENEAASANVTDQVSINSQEKQEGTVSLRLLHINDLHGAVVDE